MLDETYQRMTWDAAQIFLASGYKLAREFWQDGSFVVQTLAGLFREIEGERLPYEPTYYEVVADNWCVVGKEPHVAPFEPEQLEMDYIGGHA